MNPNPHPLEPNYPFPSKWDLIKKNPDLQRYIQPFNNMETLLCNLLTAEQKALVKVQKIQANAAETSSRDPSRPPPSAYQPAIDFHTKNIELHTARIGELDQQWKIFVGAVTRLVDSRQSFKWQFHISSETEQAAEVIRNTQWAWSQEYLQRLEDFTSETEADGWVEDMERHSPGCFGRKARGLSMG